eukprot:928354-Ditylum_brightwellii.AAC.1
MVENVQFGKELNCYQIATTFVPKEGAQPLSYDLPEYMNKGMCFYLGELKVPKGRFLKNMNSHSCQCAQNMDKIKLAAEMPDLNEK